MPLTDDEIRMLASLTAHCRPTGAAPWDPPGIVPVLRKLANRPLASVMRACAAAASERTNRFPGVIASPGPHWRSGEADMPHVVAPRHDLCDDCGRVDGPGHASDHAWVQLGTRASRAVPASTGAATARAMLAARRGVDTTDPDGAGSPP